MRDLALRRGTHQLPQDQVAEWPLDPVHAFAGRGRGVFEHIGGRVVDLGLITGLQDAEEQLAGAAGSGRHLLADRACGIEAGPLLDADGDGSVGDDRVRVEAKVRAGAKVELARLVKHLVGRERRVGARRALHDRLRRNRGSPVQRHIASDSARGQRDGCDKSDQARPHLPADGYCSGRACCIRTDWKTVPCGGDAPPRPGGQMDECNCGRLSCRGLGL